jgi:hypothetical protein
VVEQRVERLDVRLHRRDQRGPEDDVHRGEQLEGVARANRLLDDRAEPLVRDRVETQRRLSHLGDALADRRAVVRVEVEVEPEPALHLPLRRAGKVRGRDAMNRAHEVVVALEPLHADLDGQAGRRGALVRADARERRDTHVSIDGVGHGRAP